MHTAMQADEVARYESQRDAYNNKVKTPSLLDLANKRSEQHKRPPLINHTPVRGALAMRQAHKPNPTTSANAIP